MNQETGIRSNEPLSTLYRCRATQDKYAFFGIHLSYLSESYEEIGKLSIGQKVCLKHENNRPKDSFL